VSCKSVNRQTSKIEPDALGRGSLVGRGQRMPIENKIFKVSESCHHSEFQRVRAQTLHERARAEPMRLIFGE